MNFVRNKKSKLRIQYIIQPLFFLFFIYLGRNVIPKQAKLNQILEFKIVYLILYQT